MSVSAVTDLWFAGSMCIQGVVKAWLSGWHDMIDYGSIAGYESRGWLERKRLDLLALRYLFGLARFRCAVLSLIALQLVMLSLTWRWDLDGWRRDLLRFVPALFVLPWLASARRYAIESMLRGPDR